MVRYQSQVLMFADIYPRLIFSLFQWPWWHEWIDHNWHSPCQKSLNSTHKYNTTNVGSWPDTKLRCWCLQKSSHDWYLVYFNDHDGMSELTITDILCVKSRYILPCPTSKTPQMWVHGPIPNSSTMYWCWKTSTHDWYLVYFNDHEWVDHNWHSE
jgi:hypothetical protein